MKINQRKVLKNGKKLCCMAMALCMLTSVAPSSIYAAKKISLNKKSVTLIKGQKTKLKLKGTKQKVKWSSNKPSVASVKDGMISARKKGNAVITAKVGENTNLTCEIKVETPKLNITKKEISVGETLQLTLKGTSQNITWSSSNKKIATVANGLVTGKSKGNVTIIAKVGGKKYSCKITIKVDSNQKQNSSTKTAEHNKVENQFAIGVNQFSYQIFEQLENGENVFVSPYSMVMMLSMLDNGAVGQTKEELEKVLGIQNLEQWNIYAKEYMALHKSENAKVLTANSIWLSDQITLSPNADNDFFSPLTQYYGAEKKQMDLTTQEALGQINQWVADKTENMIYPLLNEKLGSDVRMALINAVYFEGKWEKEFQPEDTKKEKFYGKDKTATVDMMHNYDKKYSYVVKNGMRALELPYKNSDVVMDILLPEKKGENAGIIFSKLSMSQKEEIFAALSKADSKKIGTLELPKFEFEYGIKDIKDSLQEMGIKQAFNPDQADFSHIGPNLYLQQVLHKAKVQVDETGTKAAGVTMGVVAENCALPKEEEKIDFIVNKPFVYVIRDTQTGTILFMGEMQNLGE